MGTINGNRTVNELELLIIFCGGLAKLPLIDNEKLYATTNHIADILRVTPQRVNQYVTDEGLPKIDRDRFYLPDVSNWKSVKIFADNMKLRPQQMERFLFVDFTLGVDPPIFVKPEAIKKMLGK